MESSGTITIQQFPYKVGCRTVMKEQIKYFGKLINFWVEKHNFIAAH